MGTKASRGPACQYHQTQKLQIPTRAIETQSLQMHNGIVRKLHAKLLHTALRTPFVKLITIQLEYICFASFAFALHRAPNPNPQLRVIDS